MENKNVAENASCKIWKKEDIFVVKNEDECRVAMDRLKSELHEFKLFGIHCEWTRDGKGRFLSIQLLKEANSTGVVLLFPIFCFKNFSTDLKELLEKNLILKLDSTDARQPLIDIFKIILTSTFDVHTLIISCNGEQGSWTKTCRKYIEMELENNTYQNFNVNETKDEEVDVPAIFKICQLFVHNFKPIHRKWYAGKKQCKPVVNARRRAGKKHRKSVANALRIARAKEIQQKPVKKPRMYKPLYETNYTNFFGNLKSRCNELTIIGFDFEIDSNDSTNNNDSAKLILASEDGISVFIDLPQEPTAPVLLKELFENPQIIKVGITPKYCAEKLSYNGIHAKSMIDLRFIAESCGVEPDNLGNMLRNITKNQTDVTDNYRCPSNPAEAAIQLFQAFVNKLQPEETHHIINKYFVPNYGMDFKEKKTILTPKDIRLIFDADQCVEAMKQIKIHCAQYNIMGLDCEWVKHNRLSLLQLATHRGLCLLIRLYTFKELPTELKEVLENPKIIKVGKEVFHDAKKLYKQYGARVESLLDVGDMAHICGFRGSAGLKSMTENLLNADPYKRKNITCSNWEKDELTDRQKLNAAKEAQTGIELFKFFAEKVAINLSFDVETDYVNDVIEKHFANSVKSITVDLIK